MYSFSSWTFIVLNLLFTKGTLRRNFTRMDNQYQYPGTEKKGQAPQRILGGYQT